MRTTAILSLLVVGANAFAPSPIRTAPSSLRTQLSSTPAPVTSSESSSESSSSTPAPDNAGSTAAPASSTPSANKNKPNWDVKQHLYAVPGEVTGDALPLPQTYITCGKCKSLFAIDDADLGDKGKGCRVKCSVCGNSWYQSRDRLFDIPTSSHDLLPAQSSDLDRIARNLARDIPPAFTGVGKLYVGNLDFGTTSADLLEFFESNTPGDISVCDASVVIGQDGRSRGFAFVSFYDEKDGKAALECNGKECNGRELSVREPNN